MDEFYKGNAPICTYLAIDAALPPGIIVPDYAYDIIANDSQNSLRVLLSLRGSRLGRQIRLYEDGRDFDVSTDINKVLVPFMDSDESYTYFIQYCWRKSDMNHVQLVRRDKERDKVFAYEGRILRKPRFEAIRLDEILSQMYRYAYKINAFRARINPNHGSFDRVT